MVWPLLLVSVTLAQVPTGLRGEPSRPSGNLTVYGVASEAGIRAVRSFDDSAGRRLKEIHYAGPVSGPVREDQLTVRFSVFFRYRPDGRLSVKETRDLNQTLQRVEIFDYATDGRLVLERVIGSNGRPESETRHDERQRQTTFLFDRTGTRVTGIRGPLRHDRDLSGGWGTSVHGLSVAIGLSERVVRLEDLEDLAVFLTIGNRGATAVRVATTDVRVELIGADGTRIKESAIPEGGRMGQVMRLDLSVPPGWADVRRIPLSLRGRFPSLAPGVYYLRITLLAAGPPSRRLESNTERVSIRSRDGGREWTSEEQPVSDIVDDGPIRARAAGEGRRPATQAGGDVRAARAEAQPRGLTRDVSDDEKGLGAPFEAGVFIGMPISWRPSPTLSCDRRDELLAWVGGAWDPDAFDSAAGRFDDPKRRWRNAFRRTVT